MPNLGDLGGLLGFVFVAALGAAVGIGELVARYRDEPVKALRSWAAVIYVGVNMLASVAALATIHVFDWFGATPPTAQSNLTQVLIAGFGAMAVFRSSLFVVRVGTDDVGIGPVAFLQVILGATDRGVDRSRGVDRAPRVAEIMKDLTFADIAESLPPYAMALLQNVDPEDAQELGERVAKIRDAKMADRMKVLNLGLVTMNVVGEDVLAAAASAFRKDVTTVAAGAKPEKPKPEEPKPEEPKPEEPKPEEPKPEEPKPEEPKPEEPKPEGGVGRSAPGTAVGSGRSTNAKEDKDNKDDKGDK